jgi:hypothetical protein
MSDDLADLLLGDAIVEGAVDVSGQLLVPVERGEHGDRDQAAVALGKAGAFPDVAEEPVVGGLAELGEVAGPVGGRARVGHRQVLLVWVDVDNNVVAASTDLS